MPLDSPVRSPVPRIVVRGACPHDCPDTCALLVTVENGRAIKVDGAPDHPSTRGTLCTKVARYLDRTYAPDRVLHPLRRVGPKGSGRFERIAWDEALDTIAARFKAIAASPDGPQAILPYSYAGTLGLMNVLVAEDLLDHDYIARYTLGFEQLVERLRDYPPQRAAQITGLAADDIVALARDYGTIKPAVIRLNYGMQRHAGGGMAMRTAACLPALVGAWRDPAGGALLSSSGTYPVDNKALERPDLIWNHPRTINMSTIGDALLEAKDPPIRAIYVYNSNPVAVAPESTKVVAGFSRQDLFCVVHDVFLTDTADYAEIVLPATTQLEHVDVHSSYGHLYVLANNPAIAPVGEAKPNTEVFRLLAERMGFEEPCFRESDEDIARHAFVEAHPHAQGLDWETLKQEGWQRLNVPAQFAPFAQGNFPTPSGKCEFYSETLRRQGVDPLPTYTPPRESVASNPALAARFPLAMISPPARNALNSSFANLPTFLESEKTPHLEIHPDDALKRGIASGDQVRAFNERGALVLTARVTDRARSGVVVALSIWWRKLSPDRTNANMVTGQGLTDLGRAATFYDCLVEVARVEPPAA